MPGPGPRPTRHAPLAAKRASVTVAPRPRGRPGRWLAAVTFGLPALVLLARIPPLEFFLASADHGYQLSLGRQLLLGRFPFVDLFFHYGPLTAATSAAATAIWDSPLSEALVCAAGHAAALACLAVVARRTVSAGAGLVATAAGLVLLARFYKWYFWLFPLVCLVLFERATRADRPARRMAALGAAAGIAALYRLDLGAACLVATVLGCALHGWLVHRPFGRSATTAVLGAAVPIAAWLAVLGWRGGAGAVFDYVAFTVSGARSAVAAMALPFPRFRGGDPLGAESALFAAFTLSAVSCAACVAYALARGRALPPATRHAMATIATAAVLGLALLPHALHRPDGQHLLQVIPPAVLVVVAIVAGLWTPRDAAVRGVRARRGCRASAVALGLVAATVAVRLPGRLDLAAWDASLGARYRTLAAGLPAVPDDPVARLVAAAERLAPPGAPVLVLPRRGSHPTQLHYFIRRPVAGLVNVYLGALFAGDPWRTRNAAAVMERPPAVVIAAADVDTGGSGDFALFHPELERFVRARYTEVAWSGDGWVILRPGGAPPP